MGRAYFSIGKTKLNLVAVAVAQAVEQWHSVLAYRVQIPGQLGLFIFGFELL